MTDDLEVVPKDTLNKMLEMQIRVEELEQALRVIVQVWDTDQPISIAKAALARDAARQVLKEKKDDIQNHD